MGSAEAEAMAALRGGLTGTVFAPGEAGYDEARTIFNAMIDRRPAAIAQCEGPEDVRAAVAFGREQDLEIAVRSGGHSVAGASLTEGGLVIDLRRMSAVDVDAGAMTARVGGGATWSDVDRACQPHALATTGGRVSTTGVAGLTLGGGSGWLERKFGLACDSLLSVDLITADGRAVTASEDENSELFWALHGGGGNFGIATGFTFRLHPLPAATFGLLAWPSEAGPGVARAYRDLIHAGASEDLGGGVAFMTGPPEEFVPEHLHGRLLAGVIAVYAGTEAEAREAIAAVLDLNPEVTLVAEMPYADIQCAIDDPPGYRNYWSAEYLAELPDEALDRFCDQANEMIVPSPSQHILFPWGGAVTRAAGDWPVADRDAPWVFHPFGLWEDPDHDERAVAWARDARAGMREWSTGGVYLNFITDEGEDRVVAGYGGRDNYDRLAAVKAEFDPENVFRLNHNITPGPARLAA